MTMFDDRPMWYIAAKYASMELAGNSYVRLQDILRGSNGNFSVFRVSIDGIWHNVVIGDKPEKNLYELCVKELLQGELTPINPYTYEQLRKRRVDREKDAIPTKGGAYREVHTPFRLKDGVEVPVDPSTIPGYSPIDTSKVKKATLSVIPFLAVYERLSALETDVVLNFALARGIKEIEELAETRQVVQFINRLITKKLQLSDKYIFTPSALSLLEAVFSDEKEEQRDIDTHVWIELETAIATPYTEGRVKAFWLNRAMPTKEIDLVAKGNNHMLGVLLKTFGGHDKHLTLNVIGENGKDIYDLTYDMQTQTWVYLASHICPTHQCKYIRVASPSTMDLGEAKPCDRCIQATKYFATWIAVARKIIARDYATSPYPDDTFPQTTETYSEKVKRLVGKGKNKHFVQETVTREVKYHIIKFDATLSPHDKEAHEKQHKANWLTTVDKSLWVWKKIHFSSIHRRYQGPRYTHLLELVREGKVVQEDGREYRLASTENGEEYVISTIVPFSKYVPFLLPENKKATTIKKVVAKDF